MFSSSRGWAYIRSVLILLPSTWSEFEALPTDKYLFEVIFLIKDMYFYNIIFEKDAEVRIDLVNPVYGEGPFTKQPGRCGEAGEFIQV